MSWGRRLREGEQPSKKKPSPRGRAGRWAPGACVVGVRGRDAGGQAWGAGSLRRRRAGAGVGRHGHGTGGGNPRRAGQPDGVGGRRQRPD